MSPKSVNLAASGTATLSASVNDADGNALQVNKIVHWQTHNSAVATVRGADGQPEFEKIITLMGGGWATITVGLRESESAAVRNTLAVTVTKLNPSC